MEGLREALHEVELPQGTVRYRDLGSGEPTLVFLHGLLVDGSLWRDVVPRLQGVRSIVPDLPLGSHTIPVRDDADLSPPGLARLVADFLAALDLRDVVLVANDTGGAIAQLVAVDHPDRIGRLVLTPCDAFDNFLPPMFRPLQLLARVPGALTAMLQPLRIDALRRLPLAFGWVTKRPVPKEVGDRWLRPFLTDAGVRRDVRKVLRGISRRHTQDAAKRLPAFDRPALVVWPPEDKVFPFAHAERLAELLPGARLVRIDDSYAFVPEDQPERLAAAIADFVREPQSA